MLSLEDYLRQSPEIRMAHYMRSERLYHVMLPQQFEEALMERLFDTADLIKEITRMSN